MELDVLEAVARPQDPLTGVPGGPHPITEDLGYVRTAIVNVFFYGPQGAGDREWVLIDAGVHGSAGRIAEAAEKCYGPGSRPAAIVLTHGHFDHVGALRELAERWDAPIYAHELELPYLDGRSAYPPPDPTVGGGAMAALSWMYPRGPFDFGGRLHPLPADGSLPGMPGWRWLHTPGHTHGHVSLFRELDRTLIAGDAVVTTRQESMTAVLTQRPAVHGPPAYFTSDWQAARRSVERIAALRPWVLATGHGVPMRGPAMQEALNLLSHDFHSIAMPLHGRYVDRPALADANGVVSVPPPQADAQRAIWLTLGGVFLAGAAIGIVRAKRRN